MDRTKKDRPKVAASEQSCPGLASTNTHELIIANSRWIASPNLDGGGGVLPYGPGLDSGCNRRGLRNLWTDARH